MADGIKRQKTAAEIKKEFADWLKVRKSDKSQSGELGKDTQESYLTALDGSHKYFGEFYAERNYENVFDIKEPEEFGNILYKIEDNRGKYSNPNSYHNFHSGAMLYLAFLNGEGENVGEYELGDDTRYGGNRFIYERRGTHGGKKTTVKNPEHKTHESKNDEPRNLIFFGAPGTGKSFLLNKRGNELLKPGGESIRVTFHPDYSYAHFVGTYKPVPEGREITYKYVPGPFMETYVKAVENPNNIYLLIIEEINRANVAAVFGDVFQLLDRTKSGESEYPVKASKDMRDYLKNDTDDNKKTRWNSADCKEIKIPANMYIWATMNSADQGVFPMDTAFKRRWEFKYLGIDNGEDVIADKEVPMGKSDKRVKWNEVRQFINKRLAELGINEDKQLGAFFINAEIIANAFNADERKKTFKNAFKNKVLMYLFEDAAKHKRSELFVVDEGEVLRYSTICTKFENDGTGVFRDYPATQQGTGEQSGGAESTATLEENAGENES